MKNALLFALVVLTAACGSPQAESTAHPEPAPSEPVQEPETSADDGTATTREPTIVVGTDPCTTDSDCVPEGCCHPAACVAQGHQAACGDAVCTSDCRFNTLDCGGACLCQAGHCAARLSLPPAMPASVQ